MVGTEPAQMVAPVVVFDTDPTVVKITWQQLSSSIDGGLPIHYIIQIQTNDGLFLESSDCDGSDPTIKA